jgi:CheY-like chemotaxis protein
VRFGLADRTAEAPIRPGTPPVASRTQQRRDGPKLAVLVVEDNSVNRRLAQIVLARHGHTITAVDSGAAALEALQHGRFDLILMDVQMPGMDGIDTTRAIRQSERRRGRRVPIIALTAHAMAGDRERCLGAGMDGYLVKPIHATALLDAVERLSLEPEQAGGSAEAESAGAHGAALLEQVGGDPRLLAEIAELFARESARHMTGLREAVQIGDPEAFGRAVHTLRGMLRGVRATAAEQLAASLQSLDPQQQKEQVRATCELLEQAVSSFRARLVSLAGAAQSHGSDAEPMAARERSASGHVS